METVEVAIVGAGVMGLSTAWRLGKRSREAVLLEQFELEHSNGSSHGPTRIFRFVYGDPLYVGMAREALPLWRELEDEAEEELLALTGGLDTGPMESLHPIASALKENGADFELLSQPSERFPGIRSHQTALFSPDTGVIAANRSMRAMTRLAGGSGVTIQDKTPVRIEKINDDYVVLELDGEYLSARNCVVSAGAWVRSLFTPHEVHLPVTVTREQIVYFKQLQDFPVLIDRSSKHGAGFGLPDRFDAPGARFGNHKTGPAVSPDEPAEDDPDLIQRIVEFASEMVPAVDPRPIATETCLYTNTEDDDFVIDRLGAMVVASPCSGHGFKFAPLIGEVLTRSALGDPPLMDLSRFTVSRF